MQTAEFKITGMTCDGCVETVSRHLRNLKDVSNVDVSLQDGSVKIEMTGSIHTNVLPVSYTHLTLPTILLV